MFLAYYWWNIIELFLSVSFFTVFVCKIVSRIVYMLNNEQLYMLKLNKIMFFCSVFSKDPLLHLSLVMRKPVFGVCDQVRLKPACSADETS